MATYYLVLAVDPTDPSEDGTHGDAEYSFCVDAGSGIQVVGSSGSGGHTFESIELPEAAAGNAHTFRVLLFSNISPIDLDQSFLRCWFRPSHDAPPASGMNLTPISSGDARTLMQGVPLQAGASNPNQDGGSYGLPAGNYSQSWMFFASPAVQFIQGPGGTKGRFEVSAEISILSGTTPSYFKVDPEMVIDY